VLELTINWKVSACLFPGEFGAPQSFQRIFGGQKLGGESSKWWWLRLRGLPPGKLTTSFSPPPPVALGISNPLPHLIPPVMPSGSTPDLRLHSNVQTLGFKICNRDSVWDLSISNWDYCRKTEAISHIRGIKVRVRVDVYST